MHNQGRILSADISDLKGEKRRPVGSCRLMEGDGLETDGHAGDWHRQVSLSAKGSIDKIRAAERAVDNGDFAENLTTEGIILYTLPDGTGLKNRRGSGVAGDAKRQGLPCTLRHLFPGGRVMPCEGLLAEVLQGGEIQAGDAIEVVA